MLPVTPLANTLLAPRAGLEPAHGLINSQVPSQLGYLGKNPPDKAKAPDLLDPGHAIPKLSSGLTYPESRHAYPVPVDWRVSRIGLRSETT